MGYRLCSLVPSFHATRPLDEPRVNRHRHRPGYRHVSVKRGHGAWRAIVDPIKLLYIRYLAISLSFVYYAITWPPPDPPRLILTEN